MNLILRALCDLVILIGMTIAGCVMVALLEAFGSWLAQRKVHRR